MTFGEFVKENFGKFESYAQAEQAFAASGKCEHRNTCFGECTDCGEKLQPVEGTFKQPSPDKASYLLPVKQGR